MEQLSSSSKEQEIASSFFTFGSVDNIACFGVVRTASSEIAVGCLSTFSFLFVFCFRFFRGAAPRSERCCRGRSR